MADRGTLVIVPARGGSKRLAGKNLRAIGGRSLIAWTAKFIEDEGLLSNAILSTDDAAIAEEGRRCGLGVPFMRPAELASDTATTVSVVMHALEFHLSHTGREPEFVAVLQPTSPIRRPGLLREALRLIEADAAVNSVVAMMRLHVPSGFVFLQSSSGRLETVPGEMRAAFVPTGSLYLTRTAALRTEASLYANPVREIEVRGAETIDIDTDQDLALAEASARV
jgi:CMP-N-acetylneuraminic acid synthetase